MNEHNYLRNTTHFFLSHNHLYCDTKALNAFSGQIPSELGNLGNLDRIDLGK